MREGIHWRIGRDAFSSPGIELDKFYTAPKGTERKPKFSIFGAANRGIDCIEIIRSDRPNDFTLVGPREGRIARIKCWIGGEADGGDVCAEGRNGVVKQVAISH